MERLAQSKGENMHNKKRGGWKCFCMTIKQLFSLRVLPVSFKERFKRLGKWLSEQQREQKHLSHHLSAICVMGRTTQTPVFALEIERSKNSTNHIMKGQMDLIWSGERQRELQQNGRRERDRERCRQNQTANATIFLGERERERCAGGIWCGEKVRAISSHADCLRWMRKLKGNFTDKEEA